MSLHILIQKTNIWAFILFSFQPYFFEAELQSSVGKYSQNKWDLQCSLFIDFYMPLFAVEMVANEDNFTVRFDTKKNSIPILQNPRPENKNLTASKFSENHVLW